MSSSNLSERINELINSAAKKTLKKDHDAALSDLKSAEILDEGNPVVLCNLAAAYAREGLFRTAIEYAEKILALPGGFIDSRSIRRVKAYSLAMINNFDAAEIELMELLKMFPEDSGAMSMLGYICEKTGRPKDSVEYYKKVITVDNNNSTSLNSIAFIMAKQNLDLNRALIFAKKALDSDPENPAYLDTVGYIYLKRKESEMARKYLKKAFEKLPANEEIKQHLNELLNL